MMMMADDLSLAGLVKSYCISSYMSVLGSRKTFVCPRKLMSSVGEVRMPVKWISPIFAR